MVSAAQQQVSETCDLLLLISTFHTPRIECCKPGYFCYSTGCCQNGYSGCEENSCCAPGESCCSGGGCCKSGYVSQIMGRCVLRRQNSYSAWYRYTCAVVNGQSGCCPNGQNCNTPQCATPGYVVCSGENFCCRMSLFFMLKLT